MIYEGGITNGKNNKFVYRIEPGLKEEAELILGQLGIPMSNAVNIFLKQVVMQREFF